MMTGSMPSADPNKQQGPGSTDTDIEISAHGDRRMLEALYLELREIAARSHLKIEYRLTVQKPGDQSKS
jgi:hypothetical protein